MAKPAAHWGIGGKPIARLARKAALAVRPRVFAKNRPTAKSGLRGRPFAGAGTAPDHAALVRSRRGARRQSTHARRWLTLRWQSPRACCRLTSRWPSTAERLSLPTLLMKLEFSCAGVRLWRQCEQTFAQTFRKESASMRDAVSTPRAGVELPKISRLARKHNIHVAPARPSSLAVF